MEVLVGIRMEATESPSVVLQYYHEILREDSANAVSELRWGFRFLFADAASFSGDLETMDISH